MLIELVNVPAGKAWKTTSFCDLHKKMEDLGFVSSEVSEMPIADPKAKIHVIVLRLPKKFPDNTRILVEKAITEFLQANNAAVGADVTFIG